MNIGEISKPTANAQELKKSVKVNATSAIEPVALLGEQLDISVKAKERYQQYKKKHKKPKNTDQEKTTNKDGESSTVHIDIIA